MLARLAQLRRRGLGGKGGVLVKAPKPGQELRIDLPAVGPRTVEGAKDAGLEGIVVRAGQVLIAERSDVLCMLEKTGLFLLGVVAGDMRDRALTSRLEHWRERALVAYCGRPG